MDASSSLMAAPGKIRHSIGLLKQVGASRSVLTDFPTYRAVLALAEHIGVEFVRESF